MNRFVMLLIASLVLVAGVSVSEAWEYTVRPGDTLSKIAQSQLGSTRRWKEIAELNNIRPPYAIRPGQALTMPESGLGIGPDGGVELQLLPRDPGTGIDFPPTGEQAGPQSGKFELPGSFWIWIVLGLLVLWATTALFLRRGCWFSLVEATFMRCVFLALAQAGLLMLFVVVLGFMGSMVENQEMAPIVWHVAMWFLVLIDLVISAVVTKRVLGCKWRSVITVGVMAHFVANLLAVCVMSILMLIMEPEALRSFFGL